MHNKCACTHAFRSNRAHDAGYGILLLVKIVPIRKRCLELCMDCYGAILINRLRVISHDETKKQSAWIELAKQQQQKQIIAASVIKNNALKRNHQLDQNPARSLLHEMRCHSGFCPPQLLSPRTESASRLCPPG